MIESVCIPALIELLDDPRVVRGLAIAGQSATSRLKQLGQCIWLRQGSDFAVFKPEFGDHWTAIVFDIENQRFLAECLSLMFCNPRCKDIRFTTDDAESGHLLGAVSLGQFANGLGSMWVLSKDDWHLRGRHMSAYSPAALQ